MNNASELTVVRGGYIYLAAIGCPTLRIPVETADMASSMFQQYRDRKEIGASDMKLNCGSAFAGDGTLVAKVSYNSGVWGPKGQLLQEPAAPVPTSTSRRHPRLRGPR
ncbi:MAG TPA: hypothetical protein VLZ81_05695 [Blastocatellia bacterium]|nr:hypothetical protein [Blastocatellia bacterium]